MTPTDKPQEQRPLLGIGSCLAGNAVRYNAQANRANEHVRDLCAHFETRTFCPEMGIGLGVPRAPIHLVGSEREVRVLDAKTHSQDYTDQIAGYAHQVFDLAPMLCGYILVEGSPSCGYRKVKRYSPQGRHVASDQNGIFAAALARADPLLPLADDECLNDRSLRESFVERAGAYHEWKTLVAKGISIQRLTEFYSRYQYQVVAYHIPGNTTLESMLANAGKMPLNELAGEFISTLMSALTHSAGRPAKVPNQTEN